MSTGERFRFDTEALASALSLARTRREVLEFLGAEVTGSTYRRLATQPEEEGLSAHTSARTHCAPFRSVSCSSQAGTWRGRATSGDG